MSWWTKKGRKVLKVAGIAAAAYFGAPYLLAAASGAAPYAGLAGQFLAGRGGAGGSGPPEGGTVIMGGGGGLPSATILNIGTQGGQPMYSGFEGGGASSQIYPGGGGESPGISPGLMIGIAAGGLGLVVLLLLIRR